MCNLFANTMPVEAMRRLFRVAAEDDHLGNQPGLPAIYPRYETPVARRTGDGARELVSMHWGFVMPQTSKKTGDPILPKAINNARDDKLMSSRFWRQSFEQRRCLIPGTAYCEAKGRAPAIYHWFSVKGDEERPPFAFAGLWRRFSGRYRDDLVEIETVTMITTTPNELTREVHPDRMPAILPQEQWEGWLTEDPARAFEMIRPFPADRMAIVRTGEDAKSDPAG